MTAKQYLEQIESLETSIGVLEGVLSRLNVTETFVVEESIPVDSPGSDDPDERITELLRLKSRYEEAMSLIGKQIAGMQNAKFKRLLYKKYVEVKSLELVAVEMNYSYQYTKHMHGWALDRFTQQYPDLKKFV